MQQDGQIRNALTVDVEDYFHVTALSGQIRPEHWEYWPCRVERNTEKLLELCERYQVQATFFVLGWVAERFPALVRRIQQAGHEVACHGYSHQLIYRQTEEVFRQETLRAKSLLEDITGEPVLGYRAASYSITPQSRWALDILCEAGFQYDSSLFPVRHDLYGMPGTPHTPYLLTTDKGASLVEFPLSTLELFKWRVPIAGGGYFRIFPYWFSRWGLSQINRRGEPFIFYLHPWEIDPKQPRVEAGALSRFRHYHNLEKCQDRLEQLLREFRFTRVIDVLCGKGLLSKEELRWRVA